MKILQDSCGKENLLITMEQLLEQDESLIYGEVLIQIGDAKNNGLLESGAIYKKGSDTYIHSGKYYEWKNKFRPATEKDNFY